VTQKMAAAVVRSMPAAVPQGPGCPEWCAEKNEHGRAASQVHRSVGRQVPVTRHWWCLDMRDLGADLRCASNGGIIAFLTMTDDDGVTEIVLQHGDMELPHVSPQAAEELAGHLRQLARRARQGTSAPRSRSFGPGGRAQPVG
jgi:hypothetical protein